MYRTAFNDKTFSGLQERSWVHNSVIDNYIQYIRYTEGYNNIAKSQYAIYSFGESLAFQKPDTYRFLSGPIFTKYKKIGLVINEKDQHWYFIGVLPEKGKVMIYDSIPRKRDHYYQIVQGIRDFVSKEQKQFKDDRRVIKY